MINPTIRTCALSLLFSTSAHHPDVQLGMSFKGAEPVRAVVTSPNASRVRQIARDLRALGLEVTVRAGFAEPDAKLVAALV